MNRWLDILRLRLRSLFRGAAVDRELDRELRFHLEEQIAELVASGQSADEARRNAMRAFGSVGSVSEECRDTRRVNLVSHFVQDFRYAVRGLLAQPGLFIAATASIALGVGANLAIFGLANSLLLSSPSATNPDRLVHIRTGHGSHAPYRARQQLNESGVVSGVAGHQIGILSFQLLRNAVELDTRLVERHATLEACDRKNAGCHPRSSGSVDAHGQNGR